MKECTSEYVCEMTVRSDGSVYVAYMCAHVRARAGAHTLQNTCEHFTLIGVRLYIS